MSQKDLEKNKEIEEILKSPEIIDLDKKSYFEGVL
jgi:hypothetical protein